MFYRNSTWLIDPRAVGSLTTAANQALTISPETRRAALQPATVKSTRPSGDKVAVLPLMGVLESRQSLIGYLTGGTDLAAFADEFRAALADPSVSAIVLLIDSPGGTVAGTIETADLIFNSRGKKPIVAIADTMAASAAYWIGSAADKLLATPSAEVGSIGALSVHFDESGALEKAGIKPTIIRSPALKAEFSGLEPLSAEALAYEQDQINRIHMKFVAAVARNRGVSPAAALTGFGGGRMVDADQALRSGMIDSIATLPQAIGMAANAQREHSLRVQRVKEAHLYRQNEIILASNKAAPESKLDLQTRRLRDRLASRGIGKTRTPTERWFGPRYAIVWDRPTEAKVDLQYAAMFEAVAPGAFAETLNSNAEVYLTTNHNYDHILARRSDFSLHLSENNTGLCVEFTLADSPEGRLAATRLALGKLRGMSFTMQNGSERHEYCDVRGIYCARLVSADLLEICLTDEPAYAVTIRR